MIINIYNILQQRKKNMEVRSRVIHIILINRGLNFVCHYFICIFGTCKPIIASTTLNYSLFIRALGLLDSVTLLVVLVGLSVFYYLDISKLWSYILVNLLSPNVPNLCFGFWELLTIPVDLIKHCLQNCICPFFIIYIFSFLIRLLILRKIFSYIIYFFSPDFVNVLVLHDYFVNTVCYCFFQHWFFDFVK